MPNYCDYQMKVNGNISDVDEFVKLIKADYNEVPKHFWRVFEADVTSEEISEEQKTVIISGYCAWSVHSCMRDGHGTYNEDNREHGTTLAEQSKLLSLRIEVFSSEPGMGFMEHYVYISGRECVDDCIDYQEMYFDDEDDFNDYINDNPDYNYTWDDVDEDGYIKSGGIEWKYSF